MARGLEYIDVRLMWFKEMLDKEVFRVSFCETTHMKADGFTKPLAEDGVIKLERDLGMVRKNDGVYSPVGTKRKRDD